MKKLIFGLIATIMLFTSNVNAKNIFSENKVSLTHEILIKKRHFSGNITLSGGCKVHYEIDIEYTLIPPSVSSIHGSITMSGPCSGTQTFRASAKTNEKGIIESVETDLEDKELQTSEFNEAFAKSLNELRIFDEK